MKNIYSNKELDLKIWKFAGKLLVKWGDLENISRSFGEWYEDHKQFGEFCKATEFDKIAEICKK